MTSVRLAVAGTVAVVGGATQLPLNAVDFLGGLRLTVSASPQGLPAGELLLDTGSSTLAFCNANLASSLTGEKTQYMSCNKYGSGNEGYWGFFYKGPVSLGGTVELQDSYFSVMEQEVSMPCVDGVQGIFGVAFKSLDTAVEHPSPLSWPSGGVGSCPWSGGTTLVGPLMHYLKSDTQDGRLGIYWSGALGQGQGELYVGPSAASNPRYQQGQALKASLGENGYYNIVVNQFSYAGSTAPVECESWSPCMVDTGTPVVMVPYSLWNQMTSAGDGMLNIELAGANGGGAVTLELDVQTLLSKRYLQPSFGGGMTILGLPLWAFYYTVFDVDAGAIEFVQHSSAELAALKRQPAQVPTLVV